MITIEPPSLGEGSTREQLEKIRSYLYRTSQQLTWAFSVLDQKDSQPGQSLPERKPGSQQPQQVFAGIKNLIVKSADIVNAYSDIIEKRLEGTYAAQSEFGSFREKTSQQLKADSQGISQLFSRNQQLQADINALEQKNSQVSAYIKTGLLREGKSPLYGLEIGQQNRVDGVETFDKFARFTSDRLSFFDSSDVEVAYISDYRLYITNAHVTGSLDLGGKFRVFCQNGLVFQWTGGKN